jgi:hypothetical protein
LRASLLALCGGLLLAGCVSHTVRTVDLTPPAQAEQPIPEHRLLDVGIAVFDANVTDDYEEQEAFAIVPEVRAAEAQFMPYYLKTVLQGTGQWGAVRVVPRLSNAVDLTVLGRIEHSDGEHLLLTIGVVDATGRVWFSRLYDAFASRYAYEDWMSESVDPFQTLYKRVADDLLAFVQSLDDATVAGIRRTAELRFAYDMAPDAFADYIAVRDGRVEVRRLPAPNDPIMARVGQVREREYLFIDTLDEHYENYYQSMRGPYQDYRKYSYDEASGMRHLRAQARSRTIAGATMLLAGIGGTICGYTSDGACSSTAGQVASVTATTGGALLLKSAFEKRAEARFHAQGLQEIARSLDAEVTPHVIELESQTLNLSGTVDEQFTALRSALRRIYREQVGLPSEPAATSATLEDMDVLPEPADLERVETTGAPASGAQSAAGR